MSMDSNYLMNSSQNLANTGNASNQSSQFSSQTVSNISTGTTSINYMDELVKEYLIYRGFNSSIKSFDSDLKQDKDRSFKPDKITDQLLSYIYSFDLSGLIDYWNYLDQKYFSRITIKISKASHYTLIKRYELYLHRLYVINTIKCGKQDKTFEFFDNLANKQQLQFEWKEWYCLPFLKNHDENPNFSIYFTQNWIDAFIVSLQNFLTIVFQSIQYPRLLNYDEDAFWNKLNSRSKTTNPKFNDPSLNFEHEYLQQELTDEFQITQNNLNNGNDNSFINMIKNLTSNSSLSSSFK
ncbi:WD repeat-containing 91 [Brachionus plicatilis]|uniref:WD repeat-containing 91 n=1 Tax=Brachionus plicatilis TaxID=10195 RepID=A0A3M7S780_BRAPC|nr:WD repeat-containing 91 [Brachionus plicatilis]